MKPHNKHNFYSKKISLFLIVLLALNTSCKKNLVQNTTPSKAEVQNLIPETLLYTIKGESGVELSIKGVGSKVFIYNSKPWQALGSTNTEYKIVSKYDNTIVR